MEQQTEIGIFIAIAWLAMLTLATIIIIFYQTYRTNILKKEREIQRMEKERQIIAFKTSVEAEEKQKERIANNLHDEIIPLLTVINQNIERHVRDLKNNRLDAESFKMDSELVDQSISGVKAIALELIPKVMLTFGLMRGLESHIRKIDNSGVWAAQFENKSGFENEVPFTRNDQLNIYRLCLEILNNLGKHAGYSFLQLTVARNETELILEFKHDGKGATNEEIDAYTATSAGLGLKSMQSRLLIMNARINYSADTDPASIHLNIPFSL